MFRPIRPIVGRQRKPDPDRQRKLGRDCLELPAISGRPVSLGSGIFLIRVSIYQGGSFSRGKSNYGAPEENRTRSTADTGTPLSGNIRYFMGPAPLALGRGPFGVGIY